MLTSSSKYWKGILSLSDSLLFNCSTSLPVIWSPVTTCREKGARERERAKKEESLNIIMLGRLNIVLVIQGNRRQKTKSKILVPERQKIIIVSRCLGNFQFYFCACCITWSNWSNFLDAKHDCSEDKYLQITTRLRGSVWNWIPGNGSG